MKQFFLLFFIVFITLMVASTVAFPQARERKKTSTQYLLESKPIPVHRDRLAVSYDEIFVTINGITRTHFITDVVEVKGEMIYWFDGGFLHLLLYNRRARYSFDERLKTFPLFTEEDWVRVVVEHNDHLFGGGGSYF